VTTHVILGHTETMDLIFKPFSIGDQQFPEARFNPASIFIQGSGEGSLGSQNDGWLTKKMCFVIILSNINDNDAFLEVYVNIES